MLDLLRTTITYACLMRFNGPPQAVHRTRDALYLRRDDASSLWLHREHSIVVVFLITFFFLRAFIVVAQ